MSEAKLDAALDMMRRMPPKDIEDNLYDLLDVAPELTEDLLGSVDQPLRSCLDPEAGKEFLLCDYNRDADFYRSPYTNKYFDPEDPSADVDQEYELPSEELRRYEEAANEVFDLYRERYYSGPPAPKASLSSCYFWNPIGSDANMAGCILFHNVAETDGITGTWDSIHVAEIKDGEKQSHYKLTTTIILQCTTSAEGVTNEVGGYKMQVMERDMNTDAENTHLVNIGTMIQDMENKMLGQMKEVYFGKTQETTKRLRYLDGGASRQAGSLLQKAFMEAAADK